ncbi:MAG TPA: hypothetical protein VNY05_24720 [Candidatus Acidoferrales bacterium]|nr:hypothetical protein [Candidatus Acidoferrales bacterium]
MERVNQVWSTDITYIRMALITLESRLWKFGCAPTPGGRIANPPQVNNLPHNTCYY